LTNQFFTIPVYWFTKKTGLTDAGWRSLSQIAGFSMSLVTGPKPAFFGMDFAY